MVWDYIRVNKGARNEKKNDNAGSNSKSVTSC